MKHDVHFYNYYVYVGDRDMRMLYYFFFFFFFLLFHFFIDFFLFENDRDRLNTLTQCTEWSQFTDELNFTEI